MADPHGITEWQWVPVAVLVGAILLEGNSFRVAVKESRELKGTQGWFRFLRTSKNPELPVLFVGGCRCPFGPDSGASWGEHDPADW